MASNQQLAQGLRSIAQQQPVMMGNPALSGAEQYGDIMKPATASTTKKLAAGLRAAVDAMGGPLSARMAAHAEQQKARMAAGDYSPTPLTGESIDLADSVAGSLVGNIGLAGALRAYHGSPHRFDRFDIGKIGTGEGAQAYGHGLYFSQAEDVASSYKQKLERVSEEPFRALGIPEKDIPQAISLARSTHPAAMDVAARDFADWTGFKRDDALVDAFKKSKQQGALYTTRLDVEPEDLLDYDAPLPQSVRDIISARLRERDLGDEGVKAFWRTAGDTGDAYVKAERFLGPGSLIEDMKKAGYKGISYFDAGSRTDGKGTRNFVIFDDSLVDITHVDGKPLSKAERAEAVEAMMGGGGALPSAQKAGPLSDDAIREWAESTKGELGLKSFDVWPLKSGDLKLNMFEVPKNARKSGIGTKAMEELTQLADKEGRRIILSPGLKDDLHGTTSRSRLAAFYKRFGFVENKGRNKDFSISEGMYREPRKKPDA